MSTDLVTPHRPAAANARAKRKRERRGLLIFLAEHSIAIALSIMFLAPIGFLLAHLFHVQRAAADRRSVATDVAPRELRQRLQANTGWPHTCSIPSSTRSASTGLMLLASVPAAYALSKLKWRGRNTVFIAIICVMMLPPQVVTIPLYLMWASFGLTGSLWPLILPMLGGDAFSIFLLRQFLVTIPDEYLDAARVDGCGEWRALFRVVLPIAKPGIAAAAMFQFFYCWNDYYGPLLYTSENEKAWTLSLGLASFRSLHHVDWNLATAATMLTLMPVVILFFFAQKAFVQGVTLTGVKG